jgi:hypothetical protein
MAVHQRIDLLNRELTETETTIVFKREDTPFPVEFSKTEALIMDGVPMITPLYQFASALRKAMPGVKFGYDWASLRGINNFGVSEVWVYYPGQEYALGYIGHGDYAINENNTVYAVYSRKVSHKKIKRNNPQHYMLQSKDMDKAVKNAKRALLPYTMQEVANRSINDFAENTRAVVAEAESEAKGYIRKCRDEDVMEKELRNLIGLGVQFATPEFQAAATHFLTAEAEARDKKAHLQGAYFIRLYERFNGMHADILTYDRKVKGASKYSATPEPVESKTLKADELPEDVQMKIATLSMMDVDTYVPMVGHKASATSFWIERSGE